MESVELVSMSEAARRLGVHRETLSHDASFLEAVPRYRLGKRWIRVDWNDVLAWLRGHQIEVPQGTGERSAT